MRTNEFRERSLLRARARRGRAVVTVGGRERRGREDLGDGVRAPWLLLHAGRHECRFIRGRGWYVGSVDADLGAAGPM